MKQRILTGVIAGAIYLVFLWLGDLPFVLIISLLALVAYSEIIVMKKVNVVSLPGLIGMGLTILLVFNGYYHNIPVLDIYFVSIMLLMLYMILSNNAFNFDLLSLILFATLYIGFGFHFLVALRGESLAYVLFVQLLIWATDSGAYFVGSRFGRTRLSKISPKKTVEGSIGGILCAAVVAALFQWIFPVFHSFLSLLFITLIISVIGQVGDLAESAIKRYYNVKDSGEILPGHGGILDRFDSLIFILPFLQIFHLL